MEPYMDLITKGVVLIAVWLLSWKVWPIVKEWAIVKQAIAIVHQMEEEYGGGRGAVKYEMAVGLLQAFVDRLGWKIDMARIGGYITSAVGMLHAAQGVVPGEKGKAPGKES